MRIPSHDFGKGFQSFGRFVPLEQLPGSQPIQIRDFSGGYDARDSAADAPRNSTIYALDLEVSVRDRIKRAPGVVTLETYGTRLPEQMLLHASLDYAAKVLLLDPPFLGVFDGVDTTAWTDHALATSAEVYSWTNYGGDLLFSPGTTAAYRRTYAGVVSTLVNAPPARAYANFAGRLFAGGPMVSGTRQPMMVKWNDTTGTIDGWTGADSGGELLISNLLEADKILSMVPIGFDLMAILCRRSIWVGVKTGLANRPADFQLRLEDSGPISALCAAATADGVVYLADDGVMLFNGNSAERISDAIEADLLPLDLTRVTDYSVRYHKALDRVYVLTPTDTWVYERQRRRWFRRSLAAKDAVPLGESLESYDMFFLGRDVADRAVLGKESTTVSKYFDKAMAPLWTFPTEKGSTPDQLVSTTTIYVEYTGSGQLRFSQPGIDDGIWREVKTVTLPGRSGSIPATLTVPLMTTGLSLGLRMEVLNGLPEIAAVSMDVILRGKRIVPTAERAETLVAVKHPDGYWYFLPYDEVAGLTTGEFYDDGSGFLKLAVGDFDGKVIRREADDYLTLNDV